MVRQAQLLDTAFDQIRATVRDASKGLSQDVFEFVSTLTPMVNVDLLIKDASGRTLLTWRDDPHFHKGWHVPGGIVRFKESFKARLHQVAATELGAPINFDPAPIAISEIIDEYRDLRGHFVSLLYRCSLEGPLNPKSKFNPAGPLPGQWLWHECCPADILPVHKMYCQFITS